MTGVDEVKASALAVLWTNVEAALDQPEVHQKFVRFAVDNDLYLPAIERYKALATRGPEHRDTAEKWQKAIAAQAAAKVFARAPVETTRARSKRGRVAFALGLLSLTFAVVRASC